MGIRVLKRAYKYRFYPTPEQADLLNRTFGSVRYVYNRALAERSRAWTQEQEDGVRLLRCAPRPGRERGEGHTCGGALR